MTLLEKCEDFCTRANIILSDQERAIVEDHSTEGLVPSQAPALIENIRKIKGGA